MRSVALRKRLDALYARSRAIENFDYSAIPAADVPVTREQHMQYLKHLTHQIKELESRKNGD